MPLFGQRGTPEEGHDCSINRDDIMRFLDLLHVQKLDIAMHRKDGCLSLLQDPEQNDDVNDIEDGFGVTPTVKWNKVNVLVIFYTDHHLHQPHLEELGLQLSL